MTTLDPAPTRVAAKVTVDEHYALGEERHNELCAWITSVIGDSAALSDIRPGLEIEACEAGYRLHLTRKILDERGRCVFDRAADAVVTMPHIVELGNERTWPAWLGRECAPVQAAP